MSAVGAAQSLDDDRTVEGPLMQENVRPRKLPSGLLLGGIVVVAAVVHAALALRSHAPWIVPDELIYSELAKSLGAGRAPSVREVVTFEWGLGYPALLAPIWALFEDIEAAYAAARIWNATILASTAVPAYFLARRFTSEGYALVAAALTVSIPPMVYAGTLMTEVALYPAFVLAVLAIVVAVERPGAATQLTALGTIAVACFVKSVASVLFVGLAFAIVVFHLLDARGDGGSASLPARLRRYAVTWLALAVLGVAGLVALVLTGRRPSDAFGTYGAVLDHVRPLEVPRWIALHLAELDLAVAVIPLAATGVVIARGVLASAGRREKLFVAVTVPVAGAWLVAVGAFASVPFLESFGYPENVQRLQGRSTFMLAPLFFIGLVMWLRDRRGSLALVAGITAAAALLPAVIPLDDFDRNVRFQALALVPWVETRDDHTWPASVLVVTFFLGAAFVAAYRLRAPAAFVIALVVLVLAATASAAHVSMAFAAESSRNLSTGPERTWVDRAVGDEEVSVLWWEPGGEAFVDLGSRHRVLFVGELFNRRVGDVYELGSPLPYKLPATRVRLEDGRVVLSDGRAADLGELVLVPCHVRVTGETVAVNVATGARVVRIEPPVRATVSDPTRCPR
jgi:hypothetical protein